jgi:aspartate aminotransferase
MNFISGFQGSPARIVVYRLADLVRDLDFMVLSDEIYSRIYYGEQPASIASLPGMKEKTILLDGFSKTSR